MNRKTKVELGSEVNHINQLIVAFTTKIKDVRHIHIDCHETDVLSMHVTPHSLQCVIVAWDCDM